MSTYSFDLSAAQVIKLLTDHQLLLESTINEDTVFQSLSYSSTNISSQTLFFCKGNFKEAYLEEAFDKGISCYMSEKSFDALSTDIPKIIVKDIQKAMALTSALFYQFPQDQLTLIGLTGTKGKTSTNYFLHTILQEAFPKKVGFLSTYENQLGPEKDSLFAAELTTPESLDLFRYLRTAVDNGLSYMVMEVSSQAYKLNRVFGLFFDVGVFLNISPDHIGPQEHETFEEYLQCKEMLLQHSSLCVINRDMDHFQEVYQAARSYHEEATIYTFGSIEQTDPCSLYYNIDAAQDEKENHFELIQTEPIQQINLTGKYQIQLAGDFNVANAAAAALIAQLLSVSDTLIHEGLQKTLIPGRMLHYTYHSNHIYVDYAHNYLSLRTVASFIKAQHPDGRLLILLGSPGNKAQSRRQDFGKVLSELADVAILTSDDPNNEDPAAICQEIKQAITSEQVIVKTILDRKEAIISALTSLEENDSILIAGKGSDAYQKINGKRVAYESDNLIVEQWLKTKGVLVS